MGLYLLTWYLSFVIHRQHVTNMRYGFLPPLCPDILQRWPQPACIIDIVITLGYVSTWLHCIGIIRIRICSMAPCNWVYSFTWSGVYANIYHSFTKMDYKIIVQRASILKILQFKRTHIRYLFWIKHNIIDFV